MADVNSKDPQLNDFYDISDEFLFSQEELDKIIVQSEAPNMNATFAETISPSSEPISPAINAKFALMQADLGVSKEFDWERDDNGEENKTEEKRESLGTFSRWGRFRAWFKRFSPVTRTMLYISCGFFLTMPLGLLSLFYNCQYENSFKLGNGTSLPAANALSQIQAALNIGGAPLFLWSLWLFISWATLFALRHIVRVLPQFLGVIANFVLGKENEFSRHYLNYIRHLRHYASYTFLFIVSYFSFIWIFPTIYWETRTGQNWPDIIAKLLLCVLSAMATLTGEKLFLQYIAVQFHTRTYKDRIWLNRNQEKIFNHLASKVKKEKKTRQKTGDSNSSSPKLSPHIWKGGNFDAIVTKVKGGVKNIISDSRKQCLRNAKSLFQNLVELSGSQDKHTLTLEHFRPLFPTENDAAYAFNVFDADNSGEVTKQEFRSCMLSVYEERKAIEDSLRNFGNVIGSLDMILKVFWFFLVLVLCCIIFQVDLTTYLATLGSVLLASTFLFSNSAQTVFDAIIFLMITHPFDVGDKIIFNDDTLVVSEMSLLTTVMIKDDGTELTMPNSVLSSSPIYNIRRSGLQSDKVNVRLPYSKVKEPPLEELISHFTIKLNSFVEQNLQHYVSKSVTVTTQHINISDDVIELAVTVTHKSNFQEDELYTERRNKVMNNK